MDFNTWLWIAVGAGVLAVVYGAISAIAINNLPAGNALMQEIAAAIQAGAQAYLNRQYSTIGVVGVVSVFVAPLSHGALSCLPVSCKHLCVCVCVRVCLIRRAP